MDEVTGNVPSDTGSDGEPNPFAAALAELVGDERAGRLLDQADSSAPTARRSTSHRAGAPSRARRRTEAASVTGATTEAAVEPPEDVTPTAEEPAVGGAVCPVGGAEPLIGALGLTLDHDEVVAAATEVLHERGHRAEVAGLRWGVLTVQAGEVAAHQLRLDQDQLLAALASRQVGGVTQLRVKVAPTG